MAHPFREQVLSTYQEKHAKLVGGLSKASHPWERADRISQSEPRTMEKPPEQAVPQFTEDRSAKDVPYGSTPPESVDD